MVTLRVSTQVIEHARQLADILQLPHSRVRVIAAYMGGGFGGKEDMTVEPYLAALVWKTRRPVRMVWERQDSLLARQKRHPFRMHYRTGVMNDGTIVAQDIKILGDAGAYPLLSSRVLFAGGVNSTGPYRCADARMESTAVFTNTVPTSAFRGFGAMQVVFGYESQMDLIAERLGLSRAQVRERNFVERGDLRVTGEQIETEAGTRECMHRALEELGELSPPTSGGRVGRGFACSMQPYGRSMFFADRASCWIGLEQDGTMVIRAGVTDLGAGQAASLANIAGEILGVTVDRTSVHIGDSHLTPLTGGTFATRQLYMSGNATVKVGTRAARQARPGRGRPARLRGIRAGVRRQPGRRGRGPGPLGDHGRALADRGGARASCPTATRPSPPRPASSIPRPAAGRPTRTTPTAATRADVEVDEGTGEVKILKYVAVHDIGRAIDMQRVEGQIQGAVAQGIGYAMSEEMEIEDGVLHSTLFANYLIPTSLDLPDINAIGLELYLGKGPFGARGIGEPPIGPCGPALASAIQDAIGVRLRRLPMTPERILAARCVRPRSATRERSRRQRPRRGPAPAPAGGPPGARDRVRSPRLSRQHAGLRTDPVARRAGRGGGAGGRRGAGQGRVLAAGTALVQGAGRLVGRVPRAACALGRDRRGGPHVRAPARGGGAACGRCRSAPRPTATTAAPSRRWPRCWDSTLRSTSPTTRCAPGSRPSRERAPPSPWSTGATTTPSPARRRTPPRPAWSSPTRRGRDTSRSRRG